MNIANLSFELAEGAESSEAVALVKAQFDNAPEIEKSIVSTGTDRIGVVEATAFLAAAVVLVNQGSNLLEALTKLVATARKLVQESKALKSAIIEIDGKKIDAATVTDAEVRALVEGTANPASLGGK